MGTTIGLLQSEKSVRQLKGKARERTPTQKLLSKKGFPILYLENATTTTLKSWHVTIKSCFAYNMCQKVWYMLRPEINHFGLYVHPYMAFPRYLMNDYCETDLRKLDLNRWLKHTWSNRCQPLKKRKMSSSILSKKGLKNVSQVLFPFFQCTVSLFSVRKRQQSFLSGRYNKEEIHHAAL